MREGVERGLERGARLGQLVDHANRRARLNPTDHNGLAFELAQAFGQQPVRDARNLRQDLIKAMRAFQEHADYRPAPAAAYELHRPMKPGAEVPVVYYVLTFHYLPT